MKTVTLKFGKEKIQGRETFFSTLAMLKSAVNNVSTQQGLSVDEMAKRLRILDTLESHSDMDVEEGQFSDDLLKKTKEIQFEDADFEKLKQLFAEVKWMVLSKFIVELDKELKEAK